MSETKKETPVHLLPVGRLINASLFEKDQYTPERGKPGTPSYKIELAFDPKDVTGENTIEDAIIEAGCEKWGDGFEDEYLDSIEALLKGERPKITGPFISGDKLAARRAEKGKPGDAYKGKLIARANTIYNKDGQDGPGGIQVWDENVKPVTIANQSIVYNGCYGQAAVTISCYVDDDGEKAMKFYLSAFQKTADGERLASVKDTSTLFKPVAKPAGEASASTGRRRRG